MPNLCLHLPGVESDRLRCGVAQSDPVGAEAERDGGEEEGKAAAGRQHVEDVAEEVVTLKKYLSIKRYFQVFFILLPA